MTSPDEKEMTRAMRRLERLVDLAPSPDDVLAHHLGALAAVRWRTTGRTVPAVLLEEERFAAMASMAEGVVLERILSVWNRPLLILKGAEIALRYPAPWLRVARDV